MIVYLIDFDYLVFLKILSDKYETIIIINFRFI